MKRFWKSNHFLIAVLSIACIGILTVCWYVGRNPKEAFQPEESVSGTTSQEWSESKALESESKETDDTDGHQPSSSAPAAAEPDEAPLAEYPKVSADTDTETVIDFTPASKPAETEPPAPEGKTILKDPGPEHPVNPDPEVTAPEPETSASPDPAPGASGNDGAVYDPVFGWVVPGKVEQSTLDSNGDPNKMVGNMG